MTVPEPGARQALIETLRADGFDPTVRLDVAIDLIQANASGKELGPVLETIETALRTDQAKLIDVE